VNPDSYLIAAKALADIEIADLTAKVPILRVDEMH
jgi:hypothetical protein